MQIDFHYFAVKVLGIYAGLSEHHAQLLAYASQYVDDATDHRIIPLNKPMQPGHPRSKDAGWFFDPICTAHKGISFIKGISLGAQLDIYLPFHFLPEHWPGKEQQTGCQVRSGSTEALSLLKWASEPSKKQITDESVIKLGIAMHTFADTWAHDGFTGLHSPEGNSISDARIFAGGRWKYVSTAKSIAGMMLPCIGHAEALLMPDQSHLVWSYTGHRGKIHRNNSQLFMNAALEMYLEMLLVTNKASRWAEIQGKLFECLAWPTPSLGKKAAMYKRLFPDIEFQYNTLDWKRSALGLPRLKRSGRARPELWFMFHKAAYEQRIYASQRRNTFAQL
jgi:hypothetical protein